MWLFIYHLSTVFVSQTVIARKTAFTDSQFIWFSMLICFMLSYCLLNFLFWSCAVRLLTKHHLLSVHYTLSNRIICLWINVHLGVTSACLPVKYSIQREFCGEQIMSTRQHGCVTDKCFALWTALFLFVCTNSVNDARSKLKASNTSRTQFKAGSIHGFLTMSTRRMCLWELGLISSSSDRIDNRSPLRQPSVSTVAIFGPFSTNAEGCTVSDLLYARVAWTTWVLAPAGFEGRTSSCCWSEPELREEPVLDVDLGACTSRGWGKNQFWLSMPLIVHGELLVCNRQGRIVAARSSVFLTTSCQHIARIVFGRPFYEAVYKLTFWLIDSL